jgi:enterochelin esterase-like enzyme
MPVNLKKKSITLGLVLIASFLITSCALQGIKRATATVTPTTKLILSPTATPLQLTATATIAVCSDQKGKIKDYSITSKTLGKPVAIKVYTPPCYDTTQKYPVLYMLHGMTFLDDQWVRIGITDAADKLIEAKEISPLIIVMPQEDSSMLDAAVSKYGDALINDVIPWVDGNLAACTDRACRAIGGLSRGGNWAVRLGLSYPDKFAAIGAHSAPLFVGDLDRLGYWVRQISSPDQVPAIYIDAGKSDEDIIDILNFDAELKRLHVVHEFNEFDGLHDETYWSAHVEEYLRWYASVFAAGK